MLFVARSCLGYMAFVSAEIRSSTALLRYIALEMLGSTSVSPSFSGTYIYRYDKKKIFKRLFRTIFDYMIYTNKNEF